MRRPQHASGDRDRAGAADNLHKDVLDQPTDGSMPATVSTHNPSIAGGARAGKGDEFGGPWGAAALTIGLPLLVLYVTACTEGNWGVLTLPKFAASRYFDIKAFGLVLVWYLFQAAIYVLPVGRNVLGVPLKNGQQLKYRCNGFVALIVSLAAFALLLFLRVPVDRYVAENIPQLMVASTFYATAISLFAYRRALRAPASALSTSATGGRAYDFYMGRELNPRVGSFDLKFFFELRPGLIGWVMVNLCLLSVQSRQSDSGLPAVPLALVTAFQLIYVADALWSEPAVLTTFDILHEGFGFMLAFGDLVWVPFLYTLQPRFIFSRPSDAVTNPFVISAIIMLNVCGLLIFRAANNQKNRFRSSSGAAAGPQRLESIPTAHPGKQLLVGGWWGVCRRPNYLGDLLMSLAWCLPCGVSHALPYFYPVYFFVLLVYRQRRDEALCRQRYGAAWDEYCRRVPYKIIPFVY